MININPPEHVSDILNNLTDNGHLAFLVGGCVRDAIMGRHVHDWDVATSAAPVDVAVIFPKTVSTGEKFGTVTVLAAGDTVEVTTFRVEGEYHDNRRPESVEFVAYLDQDLSRRDFTMNAMAVSVTRSLIDPYDGIEDIKNRLVRCVGDPEKRFSEDALRMFRAFRFSAVLGFKIEEETLRAIYSNADKAKLISAERMRIELEKTLMSQSPEIAGEMIKAGLLARYIAASGYSPDRLEKIEKLPVEPIMRWCVFCAILLENHLINSAMEFLHSMHMDGKTAKICTRALSIPKFPDDRTEIKRLLQQQGVEATRCAAAIQDVKQEASEAVRRFLRLKQGDMKQGDGSRASCEAVEQGDGSCASAEQGDGSCASVATMMKQGDAPSIPDETEEGPPCLTALARVSEIIASGECFSLNKLAVSGSDLIALGHLPGMELGKTLDMLLDHVLEYPEDNKREALLKMVDNKAFSTIF